MNIRIEHINGKYFVDVEAKQLGDQRGKCWKNAYVAKTIDEALSIKRLLRSQS